MSKRKPRVEIRRAIDETLGKRAREQSADHDYKRRGRTTVRFYYEASRIDIEPLSIPSWFEHPRNGQRKPISEFTAKSRKALLKLMASLRIEPETLPLFITLNYPAKWPQDPRIWKRHLDLFARVSDTRGNTPDTSTILSLNYKLSTLNSPPKGELLSDHGDLK